MAQMKPESLAVFNSNDLYPIGADSTLPFEQHRDIFYLSGVDQEESILLLFPNALNPAHREILFVRETNEHIAVWEGAKLTKEQATEMLKTYMARVFERKTVLTLGHFKTLDFALNELATKLNYNFTIGEPK